MFFVRSSGCLWFASQRCAAARLLAGALVATPRFGRRCVGGFAVAFVIVDVGFRCCSSGYLW